MFPKKLQDKLDQRTAESSFRHLGQPNTLIDFSSNDYLGFSREKSIFDQAHRYLLEHELNQNGATGSRLLSGNHKLYEDVEAILSDFHKSESALIFNSGYDANLGFFTAVPQRNDLIFYDEFCHASIRDGIGMSQAKANKFKHNDIADLEQKLKRQFNKAFETNTLYVVTESVFSMDGDTPDLLRLSALCDAYNALLVVDEAHAIGVFGVNGNGIIPQLELEAQVFARIITFGKALGCHGAAVLGSKKLQDYLINFCRAFIYTTALPPHSLATLKFAYTALSNPPANPSAKAQLAENIHFFKAELKRLKLEQQFLDSDSAIQSCVVPGNEKVKKLAQQLQQNGFDVKPILSPTVPKGQERLRFCIHAYNSRDAISKVLQLLAIFTSA
ncbi:8-amino-7-oxononanoate synthase [Subsaximicrobium wynnwilliamsii]|uniref:8-amino-7-oxononanoate synthase n=1 Tax=Subsaximicrobium wynnwilliamsii TaxID=291179 RepID=A0A5C6ZEX3_9FLAO|nr:8-amino-7-oxononanoate synthase [Subsaximicrobium wynnwilliamsii]TXD82501.1 8-amino-7-oxononanoate synthase [Subsaximicrobium wynnwilliamsii]TXD88144.1 8-amino-7-oxononanoate synthase [Subsaximicrobium wynnwilliamsii]TXE02159.1 8-amino-7-oxononanoate synthase [Subsaximicrobium wynnwilliamsii]